MIIVDTHVVLWLALEPDALSVKAKDAIRENRLRDGGLGIADVTLFEIAQLIGKKYVKIEISMESFLAAIDRQFAVLPITAEVARIAAELGESYPKDPMDRLIGATALAHHLELVTRDRAISRSGLVPVIW